MFKGWSLRCWTFIYRIIIVNKRSSFPIYNSACSWRDYNNERWEPQWSTKSNKVWIIYWLVSKTNKSTNFTFSEIKKMMLDARINVIDSKMVSFFTFNSEKNRCFWIWKTSELQLMKTAFYPMTYLFFQWVWLRLSLKKKQLKSI